MFIPSLRSILKTSIRTEDKRNLLIKSFTRIDVASLGKHKVSICKLTPKRFKSLFGTIETLPNLIITVARAPQEDKVAYILSALEVGLDEIVSIVSELTELDRDYISDEVGIDEILDYLVKMIEANRLEHVVKNVRRLLRME